MMNKDDYVYPVFPHKTNFVEYIHYKGGEVLGRSNTKAPMVPGAVVERVEKTEEYDKAVAEYKLARDAVDAKIKADFFAEFGVENHPKRELFFSKCFNGNSVEEAIVQAEIWAEMLW